MFQRHAIERLRQARLKGEHGGEGVYRGLKGFHFLDNFALRPWALDQVGHFLPGIVVEAQVFEGRARGIERGGGQAELQDARGRDAEVLLVLPFGWERSGLHGGGAQGHQSAEYGYANVSRDALAADPARSPIGESCNLV